jgi:hypothetical protein
VRSERDRAEARLHELEQEVARERARREQAERDLATRAQALSGTVGQLQGADQALASGSSEDVGAAIARAQALAGDAAARAGRNQSAEEASLARDAQRWLAQSQEALSRGDLFQARQAVQRALDAAGRARSLGATAAQGTGAHGQ